MACPTREEYEEALKNREYLNNIIIIEYKHRDSLINELCSSQKLLNDYTECLNSKKDIIMKYELYQELVENYK